MCNTRLDVVHEISNLLRLKANAEVLKCIDNGLTTTVRLRNDSQFFDIRVKVYDLENKKVAPLRQQGKRQIKDSTL